MSSGIVYKTNKRVSTAQILLINLIGMKTTSIKEKLHQYIEIAETKTESEYTMVEEDIVESNRWDAKSFVKRNEQEVSALKW